MPVGVQRVGLRSGRALVDGEDAFFHLRPCKNILIKLQIPGTKLVASPQLEWWNAGILENWVLEYCSIG
jgi:hypothetical protein